ncbi:hypothetical protein Tco_0936102 [Tanacetum coccineum]
MNENKGIMPTKVELTLEQSLQGVSNDVLSTPPRLRRIDTNYPDSPSLSCCLVLDVPIMRTCKHGESDKICVDVPSFSWKSCQGVLPTLNSLIIKVGLNRARDDITVLVLQPQYSEVRIHYHISYSNRF